MEEALDLSFDRLRMMMMMMMIYIYICIVKPTRCTNVSNLFYFGVNLHVSDGLSVHHQEFETVHTATKHMPVAVCTVSNSR